VPNVFFQPRIPRKLKRKKKSTKFLNHERVNENYTSELKFILTKVKKKKKVQNIKSLKNNLLVTNPLLIST